MPTISQSYLQRMYRPVAIGFLVLTGLVFVSILYAGSAQSTITVTPQPRSLTVSLPLVIGPDATSDLPGTVKSEKKTATVTAKPTGLGIATPAHAHGTVTLHNETGAVQALAINTRLRSDDTDVIVRTSTRIDIPAHGMIDVEAVADPTGADGEIPVGRLTIVALRSANQATIYGTTATKFTGGLTYESGTLSADELTKASNQAQKEIMDALPASTPGTFITTNPSDVSIVPPAEKPSAEYAVTVELTVLTITYPNDQLAVRLQTSLTEQLAKDETLGTMASPTVTFEDQPTSESVKLTVKASAPASLSSTSSLLAAKNFTNHHKSDVVSSLMGSGLVKQVDIELKPWWRRTLPSDPNRIKVVVKS